MRRALFFMKRALLFFALVVVLPWALGAAVFHLADYNYKKTINEEVLEVVVNSSGDREYRCVKSFPSSTRGAPKFVGTVSYRNDFVRGSGSLFHEWIDSDACVCQASWFSSHVLRVCCPSSLRVGLRTFYVGDVRIVTDGC